MHFNLPCSTYFMKFRVQKCAKNKTKQKEKTKKIPTILMTKE